MSSELSFIYKLFNSLDLSVSDLSSQVFLLQTDVNDISFSLHQLLDGNVHTGLNWFTGQ